MNTIEMSNQDDKETGAMREDFADSIEKEENFMTSGEKVLYELLFEENIAKNQKDDKISFDLSLKYLQQLNMCHLDQLQSEPNGLFQAQQHIQEEIKNLAFSNYKTFIRTAQCSKEIYSDFSIIDGQLNAIIDNLPSFSQSCEDFAKNIQSINQARRANNLTLQKHNQLLEILEISQLMDTCVRNEYYEEALNLANYVRRLEKKYASSVSLIHQLSNDVNRSLNFMLTQLLNQLKTNIQFNQCLKIISIVRRMEVFTESELRIKFLQLRDFWLNSLLQQIPKTDSYHHISKTIEEHRIHLFDIITQYRAIFSDDDYLSTSSSRNNESKLFYCWLQQKINTFLNVLKEDLNAGVGNRFDSVLNQSMYFGLAFSRVGLDFRVLMLPIFEHALLEQVEKSIREADSKFEDALIKLNWDEMYLENAKIIASLKTDTSLKSSASSSIINPPIELVEFQPLAIYLNCLLSMFNDLRLCAPLNFHSILTEKIRNSLKILGSLVDDYYKKEKPSFDKKHQDLFANFIEKLCYSLVPFIERCLKTLFPLEQIKMNYSVDQNNFKLLDQAFTFDLKDVFAKIDHLIQPPKSNDTFSDIEISKKEPKNEEVEHKIDQNLNAEQVEVASANENEMELKNE
jgi:hypothetical protein